MSALLLPPGMRVRVVRAVRTTMLMTAADFAAAADVRIEPTRGDAIIVDGLRRRRRLRLAGHSGHIGLIGLDGRSL